MQWSAYYSKVAFVLLIVVPNHAAPTLSKHQVTLPKTAEEDDLAKPIRRFGNHFLDGLDQRERYQHNPLPHERKLHYPLENFGQPTNETLHTLPESSVEALAPEAVPEIVDSNGNIIVGDVKSVLDEHKGKLKSPESKPTEVEGQVNGVNMQHELSEVPPPAEGKIIVHGEALPPSEGKIVVQEVAELHQGQEAKGQSSLTSTTQAPAPVEEQLGLPEQPGSGTALTGTRGGARIAQPWIFSVIMLGILATFILGCYCFFQMATIQPTEELIREFLDKCKSSSIPELMQQTEEGCQTPVPLLIARRLVKRAVDEQEEMKLMYRRMLYKEKRSELLEEHRLASKDKTKEERAELDEVIRRRLLEEKEKIRAACKREWVTGHLKDPVPSLAEAEAWRAKLEHFWQQRQMMST